VSPYLLYAAFFFIASVAANVLRYAYPKWSVEVGVVELLVGVLIVVLAFRRLWRSGFLRPSSSEGLRGVLDAFVQVVENLEPGSQDPETTVERGRRLARNARRREQRAVQRAQESGEARSELVRRSTAVPSQAPAPSELEIEGKSKWDRILGDDDVV
jgi:hypothetical protein